MKKSDSEIFREAMEGVKQLKNNKIIPEKPQPSPIPKQRYLDEILVREEMLSDNHSYLETGDELSFIRAGVQHKVLKKLQRGHFSIEAELDLHGMIARIAHLEVAKFLRQCQNYDIRCARIIHGKGYGSWQKQPILKSKLNKWLQQRDEVLAFCSARPMDGGTGAVYVLIRYK
ncbi:Smr/MutS family protein [Candidatus Halobeggiatoa sp. HSG11]|nr:Smr/MutS family protein [Candidatus Halobeggiatoa sp. HSG11]